MSGAIASSHENIAAAASRADAAPAVTALADPVWSPSTRVNDDPIPSREQDRPALAVGTDGAGYTVWADYRAGFADIYLARLDPTTGLASANEKVNTGGVARSQSNAAIAVDRDNNAYVVWQDNRNGRKCCSEDIYFAKRSALGAWGPNVRVDDGTRVQRNPRIAVTALGAAVAVWVDMRAGQAIYSSTLPAGSSAWTANVRVSDAAAVTPNMPDIAIDSNGIAYAVWEDARNGNRDVYGATLALGTTTMWSANEKVSDDTGGAEQFTARIGSDTKGNVMAIWFDTRTGATQVRMSRRVSGGIWEPSSVVSDGAAAPQQQLALAVAPGGRAYAAWQDGRGPTWTIWGTLYDPTTQTWGTSQQTGENKAEQNPTLAMTDDHLFVAYGEWVVNMDIDVRSRRGAIAPI